MPAAALPSNESERLAVLERYEILDSSPEASYDDLTLLASQICGTPISLVSFVDEKRQWFKSRVGVEVQETPRALSFCAHAIHSSSIFEVQDASVDARFCDNDLVTGAHHVRFYAGAPLVSPDGLHLGTLCVIDQQPRQLSDSQRTALRALARQVVALLELRRSVALMEEEARQRAKAYDELCQRNRELRASRQEFRLFMDNSPVIAFMKDRDGRFLYCNRLMETTFGLQPNQLLGRTDCDWLEPEIAAAVRENDAVVMRENRVIQTLEIVPTPGHPRCEWLVFKFPIEQGRLARLGGVAVDLTELRHTEKLKNEFVSIVSHELRTPLTAIRGALGLLDGGVAGTLPPRALEMVGIAHKNAERLGLLINDLLDMEKIESGSMRFEMASLDLRELLQLAVEVNAPYAQSLGVRIRLQPLAPDLNGVRVEGDHGRLMQVLANLLSNAAKYTLLPGGVTVRARRVRSGEAEVAANDLPVQMGAVWPGERVRVEVCDEGAGVPAAFVPRLFESFAQADSSATRQRGGTGLGLAVSRAIIHKHGTRIGYLAPDPRQDRRGATFFFELNVSAPNSDLNA